MTQTFRSNRVNIEQCGELLELLQNRLRQI
jgi:hypothetical protein